jgi:hypothetical protein
LIKPGSSETISILLVEKDKQALLQSYERLGQSGLDHSKDKFLVQSCIAPPAFVAKGRESSELYDALTSMWNSVTSGGSTTPVFNKKLHVRHIVQEGGKKSALSPAVPQKLEGSSNVSVEKMNREQLVSELSNLRRKYDELVSFSVNLTAERDIISNTLEQTKRDYNREMSSRAGKDSKPYTGTSTKGKSLKSTLLEIMIIGVAAFLVGLKMRKGGLLESEL